MFPKRVYKLAQKFWWKTLDIIFFLHIQWFAALIAIFSEHNTSTNWIDLDMLKLKLTKLQSTMEI